MSQRILPRTAAGQRPSPASPRRLTSLALAVVWHAVVVPSGLAGQEALFQRGNQAYQSGEYEEAVAAYRSVLEGGHESAELYYNLGNAHVRLGALDRAVLSYERALRLDPGNDDAAENLRLVRQRLPDRIEPLPRFWLLTFVDRWIQWLPRDLLVALSAGLYLVCGSAVVALVLRRPVGWRKLLSRTVWVTGLAALLLGGTLVLRETRFGAPEEAVVVVSEVSALSAPSSDGGLVLFSLHAGTKVRIDQRSGEWVEVVLADGKVGWLRQDVLEVI